MLGSLIKLIRPWQWIKQVFVFLPLFFAGEIGNYTLLCYAFLAFLAFSFMASAIYCYNDIIDVPADRLHSVKRMRPIASGAVSVKMAYVLMGLMFILSLITGGIQLSLLYVIMAYFVLNILYCRVLKKYAIIDVVVISIGFVLRLLAGSVVTGVVLSHWIVLMTFLLTLFLGFAKRRDDVLRMQQTGKAPRINTSRYNLSFINQVITVNVSVTIVCYIMYTVSPEVIERFHTDYLYLTSIFVIVGLFRYIQLALVDGKTGDPTKILLKDRFTQLVVACWLLSFLFIIYNIVRN